MNGTDQFEKSLKLTKTCLLLSGIKISQDKWHPIIEKFLNEFLFYFNVIILYSVLFGEIYWIIDGVNIGRDFVEISLTVPCITISVLSTLKATPLYLKTDLVCYIVNSLRDIHPKGSTDYEENKDGHVEKKLTRFASDENTGSLEEENVTDDTIVSESVKLLQMVGNIILTAVVTVLIMFLLAPLVSAHFEPGESSVKYPFAVKYWFDVYQVRYYPVVFFHQAWATIIVCQKLVGTEVLFYSFCTYIEMHFRILCRRCESIQPGCSKRIKEELVEIVKKHQLLIHLVEQTESLFSLPVLFHIVCSSFLICLSAFNITGTNEIGFVFAFVSFLMLSMSQVSLLCYFGDKLMRSSTEMSGAIYKCPWYEFDMDAKKAVLFIAMRAQKPCKLTAYNFADVNLRVFTTILSRSWSYFALLKTMYN